MRIVAGRFRGRLLTSFKADHIRPTTDRVKESIFNKLQGCVEGENVLDLFAGTGNLSCEAISRGALTSTAVELSRKSIAIICENARLLDIENELQIVESDVIKFLQKYSGPAFGLIFADPPFTEKLADRVLEALGVSKAVSENSILVVEASSHELVKPEYPGLEKTDSRDYGDKQVSFWRGRGES